MNLRTKVAAVGATLGLGSVLSSGAYAALATEVTTSITNAQADMTEAGGLLIASAALVMGLRWVKAMFF